MKSPLLKSEQLALSYTAKIYYYLIFEHYSYAINDNQKELESLEKLTEVFKAFNIYPHDYPLDYISIYNRILALKKYVKPETFYDEIAILRKFTLTSGKRNESIAQRVFIIIATNELEYLLVSHQYKKAIQKIEDLKIESAAFAMPIEPYYLIHFYYLFGLTYFNAGAFSKSIDYINIILNRFSLNDRPAVFIRVEMLKLLNHFELGNLQLVSQICRQLKKKYYKKELLSIIEIDLIKVFTKATDVSGNRALMKGLNKVYTKHTIDTSTIIFNKDYMIENYLKWIEAFTARTTLLHLVDQ
jgi:tetratricopeptide (TPR) repeat protein